MGSPLAPILANLFLGSYDETWLNNFNKADILLYRRHVDDTFCVFKNIFLSSFKPASVMVCQRQTISRLLCYAAQEKQKPEMV